MVAMIAVCAAPRETTRSGAGMTSEIDQRTDVFVHPDGRCDATSIGPGTRVWGFAQVLGGAVIGRDCNICSGAFVEGGAVLGDRVTVKNGVLIFEGVSIGDDVFLGPGAVFTNDLKPRAHIKRSGQSLVSTTVEDGVTLGAGVVVVCGVTIGHDAFIGAGAVVTSDVAPHAFLVGSPARHIGWACRCGERLPGSFGCACGRRYRLDGDAIQEVGGQH